MQSSEYDAIVVGSGISGGWAAKELTEKGLRVLLLERGARTGPWLNRRVIEEWINYRGELWPRHGRKLWLVLTLEVWLRTQE